MNKTPLLVSRYPRYATSMGSTASVTQLQRFTDLIADRVLPATRQAPSSLPTRPEFTAAPRVALSIVLHAIRQTLTGPSLVPHPELAWLHTIANQDSSFADIQDLLLGLARNTDDALCTLPTHLVQHFLAPSERQRSGAFYTPGPVADLLLDQVGWSPDDQRSLLDPTCGTGIFLCRALVRRLQNRDTWTTEQTQTVVDQLVGVDIDPLAVLATETSLLLILRSVLPPDAPVPQLNVHLGDVLSDSFIATPADVIVGNPPWLRWSNLPAEQQAACRTWVKRLDLLTSSSYHGGSELDTAAVVACINLVRDLRSHGTAALLLPDTLMKTPAAARFRQWQPPNGPPVSIQHIYELTGKRVFAGASFRTIGVTWKKNQPQQNHIDATRVVVESMSLTQAKMTRQPGQIARLGTDTRWAWTAPNSSNDLHRLSGTTTWLRGRKGITTDLNGAYFVRILGRGSEPGTLRVINDVPTRGHAVPAHTFDVEQQVVFPLIKGGKQVHGFHATVVSYGVLVPNRDVTTRVTEHDFGATFPLAYDHFRWVESETNGALSHRSTYRRMLQKRGLPFFFIYNVGPYTFAPIKVVWPEFSSTFAAAVLQTDDSTPNGWGSGRVIVPDHKIYFAALPTLDVADYLCAWLNSTQVTNFIRAAFQRMQTGTLFQHLRIPPFDPASPEHRKLAQLAATCRQDTAPNDWRARLDNTIDDLT